MQGYKTGKEYTLVFDRRTRIETIINEDKANSIIVAMKGDNSIHGKIFTSDMADSHHL